MKKDKILKTMRLHFNLSFSMLEEMIEKCPEDLWNEKKGGFVFWQQLLHAFCGMNFWMRMSNEEFIEPFADKKVYPELEQDPESQLTKSDIADYKNQVKEICKAYFEDKDDEWLSADSIVYDKIKNLDVILMQIRHIQYHVGHCNSILRENNREAVDWIDIFGE